MEGGYRHATAWTLAALGLAADEVKRSGLDERKRRRLLDAGADLLVSNLNSDELSNMGVERKS